MPVGLTNRRTFIAALGGAATWPLATRAQQSNRVRRIGLLAPGGPIAYRFYLAAFGDGLRALNYVEGQNINIEYRWAEGNVALLPELAKELVDRKVDIILAGGNSGGEAAMHATSVIPIVSAGAMPSIAAKRMQIMLELKPEARRAAILRNPTNANANLEWEIVKEFAAANNITL